MVDYVPAEGGASTLLKTSFKVEMSINFTKNPDSASFSTLTHTKNWMEENMGNLYLYTFLSPHSNVNQRLANKTLNMLDLFAAYDPPTVDDFKSDHYLFPHVRDRMIDSFVKKEIDMFEAGGGTSGGDASLPPDYYSYDADGSFLGSGDGLTGFYYACTPELMRASMGVPGSVFHRLFYGNSLTGPWTGSEPDLPATIRYDNDPWITSSRYRLRSITEGDFDYELEDVDAVSYESLINLTYGTDEPPMFESVTVRPSTGGRLNDGLWETDAVPDGQSFIKRNLATFLTETFEDGAPTLVNELDKKIRLVDLLDTSEGKLIAKEVYDENGNEIIQIAGIEVNFEYDEDLSALTLSQVDNLFVIATVGLDVNEKTTFFGASGIGRNTATIRSSRKILKGNNIPPRGIFNNYFGNITYESVLRNNSVDDSFTEIFVDDNGTPFDGIPIQALNGEYYADEPVSRTEIIAKLQKISSEYRKKNSFDKDLHNNVKNLQYILAIYRDSTNLFTELKRFQRTYTMKSRATKSGQFYAEVVNEMVQFSKKITTQQRLNKKLILNVIVVDLRPTKFVRETYYAPNPSAGKETGEMETYELDVTFGTAGFGGLDLNGDGDYSDPGDIPPLEGSVTTTKHTFGLRKSVTAKTVSDDYIPRKWFQLSREIRLATDPRTVSGPLGLGRQNDYDTLLDEVARDAGYTDFADAESALGSVSYGFQTLGGFEMIADELFFNDPEQEVIAAAFDGRDIANTNHICCNHGYFFFDWEKALHQQSMASKIVKLSGLHRFLGISMPYEYFRVTEVRMVRKEMLLLRESDDSFALDGNLGLSGDFTNKFQVAEQVMEMDTTLNYPASSRSHYKAKHIDVTEEVGFGFVHDSNVSLLSSYGAGYPEVNVNIGGGQNEDLAQEDTARYMRQYSYLKFINFDVIGSSKAYRLEGHGEFTPYGKDVALQKGYKIRDGYRLMCFEFEDFMDDDIAYHNTIGAEGDRADLIAQTNSYERPNSEYLVQILVEDRTMKFLVGHVYNLVMNVYAGLKEYVLFAEEVCSYNNITNQFNQFFIDAINAKYPTAQSRAWVRAAFVINSCRAIFFNEFSDEDQGQEAAIIKNSVDLINKMSPERGTLENLRAFLEDYRRFIMFFDPYNFDADVPVTDVPSPFIYDRIIEVAGLESLRDEGRLPTTEDLSFVFDELQFVNGLQIDQPIYGDVGIGQRLDPSLGTTVSAAMAKKPLMYIPNLSIGAGAEKYSEVASKALRPDSERERFLFYHIRNVFIKNSTAGRLMSTSTTNGNPGARMNYARAVMLRIANYTTYGGKSIASSGTEYLRNFYKEVDATASGTLLGSGTGGMPGMSALGAVSTLNFQNRPGVYAQVILYVLQNQVYPKLRACDSILAEYLAAANAMSVGGWVHEESNDFDDVEERAESLYSDPGDGRYSAYDTITAGLNRDHSSGLGLDEQSLAEVQYIEFRYAIAAINNALIDIIKGVNNNLTFGPSRRRGTAYAAEAEIATTYEFLRFLLDPQDPVGPDYLDVFDREMLKPEDGGGYKIDTFYDDITYGNHPSDPASAPLGFEWEWYDFGSDDDGGGGGASAGNWLKDIINALSMGGGFSDVRLKEEIQYIGESPSGIPKYTFVYKHDDTRTRYHGVMAQDIMHTHPEAVSFDEKSGYYRVDYNAIDVDLYAVDEIK